MSRQGQWQLSKLVFSYCKFSGSSRGAREFKEQHLKQFKDSNPQLFVEELIHPGSHPVLKGIYRQGTSRSVGIRNAHPTEILRQVAMLRDCQGRKASLKVKHRHKPFQRLQPDGQYAPSVQGVWRPGGLRAPVLSAAAVGEA